MILVEIVISAVTYRVSTEYTALTNSWDGYITKFSAPQFQIKKSYGGYIALKVGGFTLSPDFFTDNSIWEPSREMDVSVYYTASTEAAKTLIFAATAHRKENNREGVKYNFYTESYTDTLAKTTALSGTIIANFTTWCSTLSLTLDSTYARASSPALSYTTTKEYLLINAMSEVAAFFTHCFFIVGSTLYLVDMLRDNGSRTLTEFDIFPSSYRTPPPIASAATENFVQYSAYPYGKTITGLTEWHTTQANAETALGNILTVSNASIHASVKTPLDGTLPTLREQITLTDASLGQSSTVVFNPSTIKYDFIKEEITLSGDGTLT